MKRGRIWTLDTFQKTCRCGTHVFLRRNSTGDSLLPEHLSPNGKECNLLEFQKAVNRTRKAMDSVNLNYDGPDFNADRSLRE